MSRIQPLTRTAPEVKRADLLTWVPVTGLDGRVRWEMRWHVDREGLRRRLDRSAA